VGFSGTHGIPSEKGAPPATQRRGRIELQRRATPTAIAHSLWNADLVPRLVDAPPRLFFGGGGSNPRFLGLAGLPANRQGELSVGVDDESDSRSLSAIFASQASLFRSAGPPPLVLEDQTRALVQAVSALDQLAADKEEKGRAPR